jgi:hypothetical protein
MSSGANQLVRHRAGVYVSGFTMCPVSKCLATQLPWLAVDLQSFLQLLVSVW